MPTFYKKNSIFCRWNKSTCDFIPHLFVSIFLHFDRCSLTSPLVAKANQFTNLQTHSGLEGICLFRKKAFQFELLFYCLLFANYIVASLDEDGFCGNGNILKNTNNIIGKKWTWSCWKDIEIIERGSLSYIWTNCARSVKAIAALWWWDFAQRKVK